MAHLAGSAQSLKAAKREAHQGGKQVGSGGQRGKAKSYQKRSQCRFFSPRRFRRFSAPSRAG
jgi:hypothetical protein